MVPRGVRHERRVGVGGVGGGGEEEEEDEERRKERVKRDWMSCSNRFLPGYSARSPSLLHPSGSFFGLIGSASILLYSNYCNALIRRFVVHIGPTIETSLDQHRPLRLPGPRYSPRFQTDSDSLPPPVHTQATFLALSASAQHLPRFLAILIPSPYCTITPPY